MRTRAFFFCFAATVLLASCSQEPAVPENVIPAGEGITEIRLGIPDTKTVLGEKSGSNRKVYWADGDKIVVNGVESAALSGVAANSTSAVFTLSEAVTAPLNVLYPAEMYNGAGEVKLPANQAYTAGTFASGTLPMAGSASSLDALAVNHICAVIKLPILKAAASSDTDNLSSVSFQGNASEQVSGAFSLDYSAGILSGLSTAAADKTVTVSGINAPLDAATPVDVYIVVPAREYASGFSFTITDDQGHSMTKSLAQSKTLEAGHIYSAGEFAFAPAAGESSVTISSANDLVTFAQKYNAGDYDEAGDDLVVTFLNDISFNDSSSSAFAATGGIGSDEHHFHGTVDGNGKAIRNFKANVPLFAATGTGSVIKDLEIDSTCEFIFTHGNEAEGRFGALIAYNKSAISNVHVNATISMKDATVSQATYLGGIAGRSTSGTITDSSFGGKIVLGSGYKAADKKILVGGIVGYVSNEAGIIESCRFSGTIDNQSQMVASSEASDFKSNPQLMIGGIAGFNNGTIEKCITTDDATGISVTLNDGSDHTYTGTIVTHTANAYHYAVAGIAGRNNGTVADCQNFARIVNIFSADRGTSGNLNGRYLNVAGIVGFNGAEAAVTGCLNSATIIDRATPKMHYVGGIVGRNYGTVSNCENADPATIGVGTAHLKPYSARMLYLGGAIGSNETGATASGLTNGAKLNVSRLETTTGYVSCIGGLIGKNSSPLNSGKFINTGDITQSSAVGKCAEPTVENDYGLFLGGIAGYSIEAISNASNSGNVSFTCNTVKTGLWYVYLGGIAGKVLAAETVDISACSNSGKITFTANDKCSEDGHAGTQEDPHIVGYDYIYLGGLAGYASNVAFKNNCSNSGSIKGGDSSGNNNRKVPSFTIGGIAGLVTGASSIANCKITGEAQIYNDHFSNRGIGSYDCPTVGGIAGLVAGADGALIPVSNCSVESTASVVGRRGAVGGIIGLAKYATISGCSYVNDLTNQSAYFVAGIVGGAQYSTVSNCTYKGSAIQTSQLQIGGGIIGKLDEGSSVSGCSSYLESVKKNDAAIDAAGGIAGQSVEGTSINNSHYKSAIAICGDDKFTGSGNAADL
ncbi:MAG: hypothetical protein J6X71_06240 [Bacteroidales bacterium]|nr:hypothetical protein [Bacteroidales bacterium]